VKVLIELRRARKLRTASANNRSMNNRSSRLPIIGYMIRRPELSAAARRMARICVIKISGCSR
jgi:hypothetical protein